MKYEIIYADPPWRYSFSHSGNRKIENKYPTMSLEEIKEIPINLIADNNCILYLWATSPKLIEALEVMKAWGFNYKTHCIWDKEIIGMGYWWRGRHELLLVGTKGKASPPLQKYRDPSVYKEKRSKHSKKPDHFRDRIQTYFPSESKVELFARQKTDGWDIWGNELENDLDIPICLR